VLGHRGQQGKANLVKEWKPRFLESTSYALVQSLLLLLVLQCPNTLVALFDDKRVFIREATGAFSRGDFPWRYSFCGWTMASSCSQVWGWSMPGHERVLRGCLASAPLQSLFCVSTWALAVLYVWVGVRGSGVLFYMHLCACTGWSRAYVFFLTFSHAPVALAALRRWSDCLSDQVKQALASRILHRGGLACLMTQAQPETV